MAAATVIATGLVALGVCAAPAQAAALPTTTTVSHVRSAALGPASSLAGTSAGPRTAAHAGAVRIAPAADIAPHPGIAGSVAVPVEAAAAPAAAAAADSADSTARSRLWHQTLAEFGILAAAFAVFARRSFRPRRARRAPAEEEA
ncbi:MAG TPA: hypothetical protein VH372_23110 [Actinospica sp.]|nr:hypothetical protein [Actinospica sp.]